MKGRGFSETDKIRMFRRYSAVFPARPTGGEALHGLGSRGIVKKLVLAMHGELACESSLGQGATFAFRLHSSNTDLLLIILYGLSGHRRRQDIPRRDVACSSTAKAITPKPPGQAELGLTELKEGKFDAVLLDLNLGAEKGLDVLEQILKRQPNLPVIIFTAQGSVKNAVEANAARCRWIFWRSRSPANSSTWCSHACSAFTNSIRTSNGSNAKLRTATPRVLRFY